MCNEVSFSDSNIDDTIDENRRGVYLGNRLCIAISIHVCITTNSQSFLLSQQAALASNVSPSRFAMGYTALKVHYCSVYRQPVCTSRIVIAPFHSISTVQWLAKRTASLYGAKWNCTCFAIDPFHPDLPKFNYRITRNVSV